MAGTIDRDVARQVAVVAAVVGGVLSGATGQYGDGEDSADPVLPADAAFAVWAPIYAGVACYAVHQARPGVRRDPLLRRTGWPLAAAVGLSGLWVKVQDPPVAQLPLVAATTAAALGALLRSAPSGRHREPPSASSPVAEEYLVRVPIGLLAGWLTLATSAATTEVALASGLRVSERAADRWGALVLVTTAALGALTARRAAAPASYPLVLGWGLAAVAVRDRRRYPISAVVAVAAAAAFVVEALRAARPRRRR